MWIHQWRRIPGLVAAVAFVLANAVGAAAETTYRVPGDFETIGAAMDTSVAGDTILVGPGTYKESLLFTEKTGNGIILKSTDGSAKTTIAYGEEENQNEAVITFQRCNNSTQFIGFSIDGRGLARRGILTNSDSKPVLQDIQVDGCEYAIAVHRGSRPWVRDAVLRNSRTAGLFISGGSVDVKDTSVLGSEKFGVYVGNATEAVLLRNVIVDDNGQVGVQAAESEISFLGGKVTNNGDTGLILNETTGTLSGLTVTGHTNIGIVMEIFSGTVSDCRIADNEFGAVSAIEGSPRIIRCVFENNSAYHLGIEGDAQPLIGGSLANGNLFLGEPDFRVQHTSTQDVIATYNYWDLPCSPKQFFQISGGGKLKRRPWAAGNLLRSFEDCTKSRQYNKWFRNDKLNPDGTHIKGKYLPGEDPNAVAEPAASDPDDYNDEYDDGGSDAPVETSRSDSES
ncbi:MAG: hypothetical protein DHS20C21_01180 [Gemmatimonadota bacterium]|nr:MAG: hypothetical protein DHS20C21_01180 [Gemmatimonadota bacterium]